MFSKYAPYVIVGVFSTDYLVTHNWLSVIAIAIAIAWIALKGNIAEDAKIAGRLADLEKQNVELREAVKNLNMYISGSPFQRH